MKQISTRTMMFGLLLVIALSSGCASSRYYTPGGKTALSVSMPASGKSKVVFLRHKKNLGKFINFAVHDDERLIGILANSTYFAYECEPGHHLFSSSMENIAVLEGDLLPDHIYYADVVATMGFNVARVHMSSLYPGCPDNYWRRAPKMLGKTRESVMTNDAVEHDQKGTAGYLERLNKKKSEPRTDEEKILPEHGQTAPVAAK